MRITCLAIAALAFLAGCQEVELRNKTAALASTVDGLYYTQVLDNVA